jgi:hypothetical protein
MQPTTQSQTGLVKSPVQPKAPTLGTGQKYYGVAPGQATANLDSQLMGMKAKDPNTNIQKPVGTIPPKQSTGLVPAPSPKNTPYDAGNPYPYYVGQVGSWDANQDPGVQQAMDRQRQFENQYTQGQMARSTLPNIGGYQTNLMNINAAGHAAMAPVYQSQVQQAYTGAGQRLSALGSAMGAAAPRFQGYAGLSPINNQPIGSGQGGGGSLNNIIEWGAGLDFAGTAATRVKELETNQGVARSQGANLVQQLKNTPEYNSGQVNTWNSLMALIQANVSNPKYANIDATLNNVLAGYSSLLGVDVGSLRAQGAQAPSLASFLSNLDNLAQAKIDETRKTGLGGSTTPAPSYGSVQAPQASNQPTTQAPTSGVTSTGVKWQVIQ